ncbi:hypothetical protein [Pseudochryseolinea flava]|uniref:Uncharacterized protein n=1 Tax=Pseudochryseolinea flava TaxID=2059302 RepID=A0A364XZU4_9BACT|nr:hypothetical protein [Pseudochryseolinea flava]RAV99530.1 hypothetical protein DQQ10_18170 [Pseudochryseolinea flava]
MNQPKKKSFDIKQLLVSVLLLLIVSTLVFLGILGMRKSKISAVNSAINEGRKAFLEANYRDAVIQFVRATDSLKYESEATELNTAHAMFLLSGSGTAKETKSVQEVIQNKKDSAQQSNGRSDMEAYTTLSATAADELIASIAYNQVGIVNYRSSKEQVNDTIVQNSMDYFKAALIADPKNETARYNYEILKKKSEYPDLVMKKVRALVKENRYNEAHQVMETAIKNDPRIEQRNQGFLKRLKDIIKIDGQ